MEITIKIDDKSAILAGGLINEIGMARRFGMINLVAATEALAVEETPLGETSDLVNSRTTSVSEDGLTGVIKFTSKHADYVYRGTGIFGPFHQRIFPKDKKALFWPGAKHPVRSIAGMKPYPWIDIAVRRLDAQKEFDLGVSNYLRNRGW